jgi:hypothetical protein
MSVGRKYLAIKVLDNGPVMSAPAPDPIEYFANRDIRRGPRSTSHLPITIDSTMSLSPNVFAAWGMMATSIKDGSDKVKVT